MKKIATSATTLLDYLFSVYPDSSRTKVKQILASGSIRINGQATTAFNHPINPGDSIEISGQTTERSHHSAPYKILLEDKDFVAVEKPVGIVSSSEQPIPSVFKILSAWYKEKSQGRQRVWVVHRLDKEVSGILLFARSETMVEKIRAGWSNTRKIYTALVENRPPQNLGEIRTWLLEDESMKVRVVPAGTPGAKEAITLYSIIKELKPYTLLEIEIKTGRKNQIRVHLSELGCPIVGDRKHGANGKWDRRVRLHATSLSFPHPSSGKLVEIQSPLPTDFLKVQNTDEQYK